MVEYILRFILSFAVLLLLQYMIISFMEIKTKTTTGQYVVMVIQSLICAGVYGLNNSRLSLAVLIIAIFLEAMLVDTIMIYRICITLTYIAIGMVIQYMVHLLHFLLNNKINGPKAISGEMIVYVSVYAIVIISLCKLFGNRRVRLASLSGTVLHVLFVYSVIETLICNIVMRNAININSTYCYIASIIVLGLMITLYYLILLLMRKMTELITTQNECKRRMDEMSYEREKTKIDRMVKHDLKRKLFEYIYLLENGEYDKLTLALKYEYEELRYLDDKMYSFNPVVNSVLRACIGKIKGRNIPVDADIDIPDDVEFYDGDFGVLLSNLVDNAIEGCEKVLADDRYINIVIKVVEENMFINIENSKSEDMVDIFVSTKDDPDRHGIGINKIISIFDKYDGKVKFNQEQTKFIVKGFLNCKNWCQITA